MCNSSYLWLVVRLSRADLAGALAFVAALAEYEGPEPFPPQLFTELERLIKADGIGYDECDEDRTTLFVSTPQMPPNPSACELLAPLRPLDPFAKVTRNRVTLFSDLFSLTELRRHPFWSEMLRLQQPFGGPYALLVTCAAPESSTRDLYFVRSRRDFSERDRALMTLLLPHLNRLRANHELRERAVLEAPDGLALTPRELEVMRWVARGKTNHEIAALLYISPGTVRRHVENAFAKLGVRTRTAAVARAFPRLIQQ
jgi:DNA-binding CsgD family transcriptional regulator